MSTSAKKGNKSTSSTASSTVVSSASLPEITQSKVININFTSLSGRLGSP